jgi:hypothetical protein
MQNICILPQRSINSADFDDPNIDPSHVPEFDDESPYPEVRSAVSNTDDQSIPTTTLRTWVLGMVWAIVMPAVNQFFFFRYPSVPITSIVAQLLSFPLGRLWAAYLPRIKVLGISLNPGPFTIKEHVLITVGFPSLSATKSHFITMRHDRSWHQWGLHLPTQ